MDQPESKSTPIQRLRFSREQETATLTRHLKDDFFVAVTGPSGCGKSTLVNENLCDELKKRQVKGQTGQNWKIISVCPGADPIGNLANALSKPGRFGLYQEGEKDASFRDDIELMLRNQNDALYNLYVEAAAKSTEPFNLLIVVDQLQDLARFNHFYTNQPEKSAKLNVNPYGRTGDDVRFINQLLAVCDRGLPVYMVFVSDNSYHEYYARHRGLLEKINAFRFSVSNVDAAAVKESLAVLKVIHPEINEFESDLLREYTALNESIDPDPYGMIKFKLTLQLALSGIRTPMAGSLNYFISEKIFSPLPSDLKPLTMLFLKALTGATGFSQADRIPRTVGELVALCHRPPLITTHPLAGIQSIFARFNAFGEDMLKVIGPPELPEYAIIDINSNAPTDSWEQLKEWSTEESNDGEVFRTLYRAALDYYSTGLHEQGPNPDKLYEGASLINALRWKTECMPNQAWANRYAPEAVDADARMLNLQVAGKRLGNLTRLELCLAFLDLSKQKSEEENRKKDEALAEAIRQKQRAKIATIAISILALAACFVWNRVRIEKQNIALMNFVRMLDYNDVLLVPATSEFATMNNVNKQIVKSDFINTETKVLKLLEKEKLLRLDGQDEVFRQISYDALINLNHLADGIQNNDDARKKNKDLASVKMELADIYRRYEQHLATKDSALFLQLPPLFNTLYAHVVAWDTDFQRDGMSETKDPGDSLLLKTIIHPNALAPNRATAREFAYGGINGIVYLHQKGFPVKQIGMLPAPVTSMTYNSRGDVLFVGTEDGDIYRYDHPNLLKQSVSVLANMPELVFQSPTKDPIHFMGECKINGALFVRSNDMLYLLEKTNGQDEYKVMAEPVRSQLNFILNTNWSNDQTYVITTGLNRTYVYRLDPTHPNPQQRIYEIASIEHPGRTINRGAIAHASIKGRTGFWLALGSMAGRLWLGHFESGELERKPYHLDHDEHFTSLTTQEGPVTALAFNPDRPQLAGASAEGMISLWNLQSFQNVAETIRIHNLGQGVTGLAYVDKDNLVVYENNIHWVMKTTIQSLWSDLNCLYQGCDQR